MSEERIPPEDGHTPESLPDTPDVQAVDLLQVQTRKAELTRERDILAQKRSELKSSIDRLSVSLAHYKKQQLQHETKQKLEYYLHQNDHECSKLTGPDDAASFVLKNLDVLPTNDVRLRSKLINKLYPGMTVDQESVSTIHENAELYTVIDFRIFASTLPPLKIKIHVKNDAIHRLELLEQTEAARVFQKISPSFCKVLMRNYCRLKKVDLIVYSYHAMAQLQQERISSFTSIIQNYSVFVTRPNFEAADENTSLISLSYIELTIPRTVVSKTFKVKLQWDIVFQNTATGEAESELSFLVDREEDGPLENANEVFLDLAVERGAVEAFSLMLSNLFGIQPIDR
ncbi:hypothetical protein OXX80_010730 [Metschnikowia pulcherrima]